MLYHGYRITFTGYDQDTAVFLISKRHSDEILAKTPSVSQAIDLINELEKQLPLPLTQEEDHAQQTDAVREGSAARAAARVGMDYRPTSK